MKKIYFVLFILLATSQLYSQSIYRPEGLNIPGEWDGWGNPPKKLSFAGDSQTTGGLVHYITDQGNRYHTQFYIDTTAGADTIAGTYAFLFTSGPKSNYWQNKWNNVTVIIDSLQSYTKGGSTDNQMTVSNGKWYTVNFEDKGYANTRAIFMETSQKPATIDSISKMAGYILQSQPATIAVYLSDSLAPEEKVYIRYTTDHWATSSIILATDSGTIAYAQMPSFNATDTVYYYAFTSTKTNITSNFGLYTLNQFNNNYSYIVTSHYTLINYISDTSFCQGSAIKVGYISLASFNASNTMTVWLSDSVGQFTNPTSIGTLATTIASDSIVCSIPSNIYASNQYRIIISSDSPADTSLQNTFDLTVLAKPVVTLINSNSLLACKGDSVRLSVKSAANNSYQWRMNRRRFSPTHRFF
ncbi:MAG: hypothetical protein HYZ42_17200 [Bacteroidetes bacterium]|nr:hypothetical protein [Bacteroidota bacterium]